MSKNKYDSKYTDKKVTPSQFIAEMMCERAAKKQSKTLTSKFWQDDDWKRFFRYQQGLANKLLQLYDDHSIILALSKPNFRNVYSLNLPALIKEINNIYTSKEIVMDKEVVEEVKTETRKETRQKSLMDLI